MSSRKRTLLLESLIREVRRFIASAILFNQKVADEVGMNLTDLQVLGILELQGSATPRQLADLTGLSSGGVTVVLDRLEKANYLRRERNPDDRRSVIVRPIPASLQKLQGHYEGKVEFTQQIAAQFSDAELETVISFFARAAGG